MIHNDILNPCPFCGGNAVRRRERHTPYQKLYITTDGRGSPEDRILTEPPKYPPIGMIAAEKPLPSVNDGWVVECEQCGARGPLKYTTPIQTREQAAALWNERERDRIGGTQNET